MVRTRRALLLCCAISCGGTTPAPTAVGREPIAAAAPTPTVAAGGAAAALVAATSAGPLIASDGPPISLTAADGTGLVLTQLEARAVVEGPLAFTELHLRFTNALDRTLEGRFAITLPDGAALSRFAMKQDRGWMEAEVVERMAARRAYEDFLHRRQDPALLENEAGNQFSARVFPIPARGDKELIIAYTHEVHGQYVLPLRGLPELGAIKAAVSVARPDRVGPAYDRTEFAEVRWTPDRDLAVSLGAAPTAIRAGDLVAVSIDPLATASPAPITGLTILFDTSASRALGYAAQVDALVATVAELARVHGGEVPVTIAAFDQQVIEIYRGPARGAAAAKAALVARTALGASDLAGALRWAATQPASRVVVIGDAVATVGDDAALGGALAALAKTSQRLDVVLTGGIRDRATAARLTHGALRDDGAIIDGSRGPAEVARRLGLTTRSGLTIAVAGARWVWPRTLDGVQPGDRAVILAQLTSAAPAELRVTAGAATVTATPTTVPAPLLARAAVGVEIARLTAERATATTPAARAALATKIVSLSTKYRVMSDLTAFLVLETEADYARFGIARTALSDILTVGPAGLKVEQRRDLVFLAAPVSDPDAVARDEAKKEKDKVGAKLDLADGDPGGDEDQGGTADDGPGAAPDSNRAVAQEASLDRAERRPATGAAREEEAPRPPEADAPPPPPSRSAPVDGRAGLATGASGSVAAPRPGPPEKPSGPPPLQGEFAEVMAMLAGNRTDAALAAARAWRDRDPGDVLALLALGEVAEGTKQPELAARAYGSIIDLFPARADLRRFAAARLARVGAIGRGLAIDALRTAVEQRPDHLTGHRLLAWELVRADDLAGAFAALERGLAQTYPADRFKGGTRILTEDLGIVAAAWIARAPAERAAIAARVAKAGARVATDPTLRFVLYWETDANDVDFHITDAKGDHAYYQHKDLASGGSLYEDVTTGYGPECFTIRGTPRAAPYTLQIHYYARGPMGYGMGLLEVVRHDGKGRLAFEHRPYVVMVDGAFVELGTVDARTAPLAPVADLAR